MTALLLVLVVVICTMVTPVFATELTVCADLKKKGSDNSTEIGTYERGEALDLEF